MRSKRFYLTVRYIIVVLSAMVCFAFGCGEEKSPVAPVHQTFMAPGLYIPQSVDGQNRDFMSVLPEGLSIRYFITEEVADAGGKGQGVIMLITKGLFRLPEGYKEASEQKIRELDLNPIEMYREALEAGIVSPPGPSYPDSSFGDSWIEKIWYPGTPPTKRVRCVSVTYGAGNGSPIYLRCSTWKRLIPGGSGETMHTCEIYTYGTLVMNIWNYTYNAYTLNEWCQHGWHHRGDIMQMQRTRYYIPCF